MPLDFSQGPGQGSESTCRLVVHSWWFAPLLSIRSSLFVFQSLGCRGGRLSASLANLRNDGSGEDELPQFGETFFDVAPLGSVRATRKDHLATVVDSLGEEICHPQPDTFGQVLPLGIRPVKRCFGIHFVHVLPARTGAPGKRKLQFAARNANSVVDNEVVSHFSDRRQKERRWSVASGLDSHGCRRRAPGNCSPAAVGCRRLRSRSPSARHRSALDSLR